MATAITTAPATSAATTTLYHKTLGCLLGGLIGDAIGTPAEGKPYEVLKAHGWIDDFDADGTDDTIMKHLLADALIRTGGHATIDDWAAVWLDRWDDIFGAKLNKFFPSVTHTAHKLRRHSVPRMAALGNMPSSSTAMCFSPVGIVNACNPRSAALQGYNLAALIHGHDVGFCQDGAVAMAAGVAEAFRARATVASVVAATQDNIIADSGAEMLDLIGRFLELAREDGDYEGFRERAYANADTLFRRIGCDSRETVPVTVALFELAGGDVEKCVTYGANFGRDADTIASMCGALGGALNGVDGIRADWAEKAQRLTATDQQELAHDLVRTAVAKIRDRKAAISEFGKIA